MGEGARGESSLSSITYTVETLATVRRIYEVEAESIEDALGKSIEAAPLIEEDVNEETISVKGASPQ